MRNDKERDVPQGRVNAIDGIFGHCNKKARRHLWCAGAYGETNRKWKTCERNAKARLFSTTLIITGVEESRSGMNEPAFAEQVVRLNDSVNVA